MANFTGQPISASYLRLLQIDGGAIQDGLGSTISNATIGSLTGSFSGSLIGTATSASFAITASFALNAGAGVGFPFTGSARITGSLGVTGSFNQRSSITGVTLIDSNNNGTMVLKDLTVNVSSSNWSFVGPSGINLSAVVSKGTGFVLPLVLPDPSGFPTTGSMYYDDAANVLYIYNSTNGWQGFVPTV
jgi:hypothetical protein